VRATITGLHVNVVKKDGLPNARPRANPSAVCSEAHLREPRNDAGRSIGTCSSNVEPHFLNVRKHVTKIF